MLSVLEGDGALAGRHFCRNTVKILAIVFKMRNRACDPPLDPSTHSKRTRAKHLRLGLFSLSLRRLRRACASSLAWPVLRLRRQRRAPVSPFACVMFCKHIFSRSALATGARQLNVFLDAISYTFLLDLGC